MNPKISLFASAIKPHLWEAFLESLQSNTIEYEVVFAGFIEESIVKMIAEIHPKFKYIATADIKPAQCYEVARRACSGELVFWVSDDCEFDDKCLDKIYEYWKAINNPKAIIAVNMLDPECKENNLNLNRFFPRNLNTPQMPVLGVMSREYLQSLGGLDRRYVYGKFESDIAMRVLADNGKVYKFEDVCVKIDHTDKSGLYNNDWSSVNQDGETLENSWVIGGYAPYEKPIHGYNKAQLITYWPISNREVTLVRNDTFEPYEEQDILLKSQSIKDRWI